MPDLLTTLRTRPTDEASHAEAQLVPVESHQPKELMFAINSPEDVLEALRSKPDYATLSRSLRWLNRTVANNDEFNVRKPSPKAAQIVFTLINDIVPDHWETLRGDGSLEKTLLIQCLSSVGGIGAITSRLRLLLALLKEGQKPAQVPVVSKTQLVEILLSILEDVLAKKGFITTIWRGIEDGSIKSSQKSLQWKEFSSLVASGKVLSIASEANLALGNLSESIKDSSWVGDGNQYASWLGMCMQYTLKVMDDDNVDGLRALSQLLSKGLSLGYTGKCLVATTYVFG